MTCELFSPNILKSFLFVAIVFHGTSFNAVQATVSVDNPEAPKLHVKLSSEGYPSTSTTLQEVTMAPASYRNGETIKLVNHVEAPVWLASPREKIARKRQSGAEAAASRQGNVEHDFDDDQLKENVYRVNTRGLRDSADEIAQMLAQRIARVRITDGTENEEYENEDDYVVAADTKMRRDLSHKAIAGRYYRDGPKIWDQWGKWTSCSASCGAGKLTRWRHCVGGGCSLGEKEAQLKTLVGYRRDLDPKIWDQWGRWSCCSVTCGVGKYTRWRHCVAGNCVSGEKEAQIKSCESKPCS